jgi:AbiV family abortive infection protein
MGIYGDWAKKAAENARELAAEAVLLKKHGHLARAYYLAHMSAEESAKAIVLGGAHLEGVKPSDLPKVTRLLRDHRKKIEFTVRIAAESSPELAKQLEELGPALIEHINGLKNGTMYTSYSEGVVHTPAERLEEIDVETHVTLAVAWAESALKVSAAC